MPMHHKDRWLVSLYTTEGSPSFEEWPCVPSFKTVGLFRTDLLELIRCLVDAKAY